MDDVLLYPNSLRETKLITGVLKFLARRNFRFESNAAPVMYDANSIAITFSTPTLTNTPTALAVGGPVSLGDACHKVVKQIRRAEKHLAIRSDYDPVIEEENISYPSLRNVHTGSIRRIRR